MHVLQGSESSFLLGACVEFFELEVGLEFLHEVVIVLIKTGEWLIIHFPGNFLPPLERNLNFVEFLFDHFGVETVPGLFDDFTSVEEVVIFLKILNDFHSTVAPLLCTPHELLEESPLRKRSGEVDIIDSGNDLVASLLGPEIPDIVALIADELDEFLGLDGGEVEIRGFGGEFVGVEEVVHFGDEDEDLGEFLVELLEL